MWLFIPVNRPTILGDIYTKEAAEQLFEKIKEQYTVLEHVWIEEGLRIRIDFAPDRKETKN